MLSGRAAGLLGVPLAALLLNLGLLPVPASADPDCERVNPRTGRCEITIGPPPGGPGTGPVDDPEPGPGGKRKCQYQDGTPTPCSDPDFGTWVASRESYCRRAEPQPPAGDPRWEGHSVTEGAVYECTYIGPIANFRVSYYWSATPPAPTLTPAEAAALVVRRMDLRAADIGIVPEDEPGSIGAVGAPVYMWTTPGPATFGPQVLIASAGGVTITARAQVDRIVWNMGDGTSVTCRTPGTPYEDRFGFADSPDCGHRYTRTSAGMPNDAYPITASSYWVVRWTGPAGTSGEIPLTLTARIAIRVGELQALIAR